MTGHPTAARVWRQINEATPWGQQPRYLIHDRDRVYGADFASRLAGLGVESIRIPIQASRANAVAERVVRSLRQESLDHILPLSERGPGRHDGGATGSGYHNTVDCTVAV